MTVAERDAAHRRFRPLVPLIARSTLSARASSRRAFAERDRAQTSLVLAKSATTDTGLSAQCPLRWMTGL